MKLYFETVPLPTSPETTSEAAPSGICAGVRNCSVTLLSAAGTPVLLVTCANVNRLAATFTQCTPARQHASHFGKQGVGPWQG